MSPMSASTTWMRTTRSSEEPADSSIWRMLPSVMRTCAPIGPWKRSPVAGSIGPMPDRKMKSPTRMPGTCGRWALRDTLSRGLCGWITERASVSVMFGIML